MQIELTSQTRGTKQRLVLDGKEVWLGGDRAEPRGPPRVPRADARVLAAAHVAEAPPRGKMLAVLDGARLAPCRYPIEQRPSRVASNLKLDTLNRLCTVQREHSEQQDALRDLRDAARREGKERFASPPPDVTTLDPQAPTPAPETSAEAVIRACDRAVEEGLISELDRLLITTTRVYGQELKEYAREQELAYEFAKKRRQRAEQVVRWILRDRPPA